MQTKFSTAVSKMEDLCVRAASISEVAKKKADQAIEKLYKKELKVMNESAIGIKIEVEDTGAVRRKWKGGEDVCQPEVRVDGPMLAAMLEHREILDLGEEE